MYLAIPTRGSFKSHIFPTANSTHHKSSSRKEQCQHKVCRHPFVVRQFEEYLTSFGIRSAWILNIFKEYFYVNSLSSKGEK